MNIQHLRDAAEYAVTFRENIQIEVTVQGISVEAYIDGMCVQKMRAWAVLDTTRQINPITYLIDQTVKELAATPRSLEG